LAEFLSGCDPRHPALGAPPLFNSCELGRGFRAMRMDANAGRVRVNSSKHQRKAAPGLYRTLHFNFGAMAFGDLLDQDESETGRGIVAAKRARDAAEAFEDTLLSMAL
jgi:hypothetical protein